MTPETLVARFSFGCTSQTRMETNMQLDVVQTLSCGPWTQKMPNASQASTID
jgi:hypothetical protein